MVALDIDCIADLMSVSPFTSYNHWNWASFYDADHFGDLQCPLRERLVRDAQAHGTELPDGRIFLLTHLRYLGYNFNPVSFFYCYDKQERLKTILAEVNNTFGETHNYWLDEKRATELRGLPNGDAAKSLQYRFGKQFHVSPFLKMDCEYQWTFTMPEDSLVIQTNALREGQPLFDATLRLEAHKWSARSLHRALLQHPWITAKVIAGIHWQASSLWAKRVPVIRYPGSEVFTAVNKKHLGAAWSPGERRRSRLEQGVVQKS